MSRSSAIVLSIALRFVSKFSGAVFFILVPFIAASLNESPEAVQTLVPIFLVGSSVSQFFVGSLADVFGKRQMLLLLLGAFVLGSMICAVSHELGLLQLGVFTLALGVGAIAGVGNTLIFDGYRDMGKAARALSFSSILVIWAPALAMNAGATLARLDWHAFFWIQAASGLVMLFMTWRDVPATTAAGGSAIARLQASIAGYGELMRNPGYRSIASRMCLAGGGIVVFYSVGLPHFQNELGELSPAIGWVPCIVVAANSVGRLISGSLVERLGPRILGFVGALGCLLGGLAMIGSAFAPFHLAWVMPPIALYVIGVGVMFSPQRAELMQAAGRRTATSESLLGILMSLSGAVLAWLSTAVAGLSPNVLLTLGGLLFGLGLAAAVSPAGVWRWGARFFINSSAPVVSQP